MEKELLFSFDISFHHGSGLWRVVTTTNTLPLLLSRVHHIMSIFLGRAIVLNVGLVHLALDYEGLFTGFQEARHYIELLVHLSLVFQHV